MASVSAQQAAESGKQALIDAYERETATTLRVLKAYPTDKAELRPHEKCKTARELAWLFTMEQLLGKAALTGKLDLSAGFPPAPSTLSAVIEQFEPAAREIIEAIRSADLSGTVRFFTGPKTTGDVPMPAFLWFLLHDQIHHRGQFSIYLRMAGGKVPSIYGPSADEPWH